MRIPFANRIHWWPAIVLLTLGAWCSAKAQPIIAPGGVVNGASFQPLLAPGSHASIFGQHLSAITCRADQMLPTPVIVPTKLCDVEVTVSGASAPVFFVSPGQINIQIPVEFYSGTLPASVSVVVTVAGQPSPPAFVNLSEFGPGLLFQFAPIFGIGVFRDVPTGVLLRGFDVTALPGEKLALFGRGFGRTNPMLQTGVPLAGPSSARPTTDATPAVFIDNQPLDRVEFSGLSVLANNLQDRVAMYEVDFTVPANLALGSHAVKVRVGASESNSVILVVGTVSDAIQSMIILVPNLGLQQNIVDSLLALLRQILSTLSSTAAQAGTTAQFSLSAADRQDAAHKIGAFINMVEAHRGKQIPDDTANTLINLANRILATL